MAEIKLYALSVLPTVLDPDAVYFIYNSGTDTGFKYYVANNLGTQAVPLDAVTTQQLNTALSNYQLKLNGTNLQVVLGNGTYMNLVDLPLSDATIDALALKADYDDVVLINGNQTINNIKTFSSSPVVPTAINNNEAVNLGQVLSLIAASVVEWKQKQW